MEAALLLVKGLTICPDTSSLPGGATAGKLLALLGVWLCACSQDQGKTAGALNRRRGATFPWALLASMASTPLFQESLTVDGHGASIRVMIGDGCPTL